MRKLKAVIVDDEKIAREVLENYLTSYCSTKIEIVARCDGYNSALKTLRSTNVDLVFLDVEMPFGNGIDVLESLGDYDFKVIFTTAFDQYTLEALNKHAFDYLLKPLSIKKLIKSVDDAFAQFEKNDQLKSNHKVEHSGIIKIPSVTGFQVIQTEDIIYIQASDNYSELQLINKQKLLVSKTLKKVENELPSSQFIRIHKSFVVNVKHIKTYDRQFGGHLVLLDGYEIPISAAGKKLLNTFF
jgi:two-component system LytT family response regulator